MAGVLVLALALGGCGKAKVEEARRLVTEGNSAADAGRLDEAIQRYDEAIAVDPKHVDAWNNKGLTLADQGKPDEALVCLDRALEIDPDDVSALWNKATVLMDLGRFDQANAVLEQVLRADPDHEGARTMLGR
jgi:tetratricopeptide (TPR) repeat protein